MRHLVCSDDYPINTVSFSHSVEVKRLALIALALGLFAVWEYNFSTFSVIVAAAKSSQLMTNTPARRTFTLPALPAAVVKPPDTNTYGLTVAWDQPGLADGWTVFLGSDPTSLVQVTNVAVPQATFRVYGTNLYPWIGVKAVGAGGVSDMSTLLTKTNYFTGWVEHSATVGPPWQEMPETQFTVETGTNGASGFWRMKGYPWNNWPTQP